MNFFTKLYFKLCFQQWNIGISKYSIAELFLKKNIDSSFTWLSINSDFRFFADPFIFKSPEGNINLIYEDFDFTTNYGKISMSSFTNKLKYLNSIELLDTKSHCSYPFVYFDKDHTNSVKSLDFSPNGSFIISGSYDSTVNLWNATSF